MSGYVESYVDTDVMTAYERLLQEHGMVKSAATAILRKPHWSIAWRMKKTLFPMKRLVAEKLRTLFSGESGRRAAMVFAWAPVTILLGDVRDRRGLKCYWIGPDGLHKVFFPKRQIFRKTPRPVISHVSIEELCYFMDPKDVYRAVYKLLHLAAGRILHGR